MNKDTANALALIAFAFSCYLAAGAWPVPPPGQAYNRDLKPHSLVVTNLDGYATTADLSNATNALQAELSQTIALATNSLPGKAEISEITNAAITLSRDKGDLNVYRPSEYGDWQWIHAPSEVVMSALSSVKPECTYSYSDGSEWNIYTSASLGYINGWAYADTPEPSELTFYIEVYDDNWNYLYEHSGSAICRRKATAYIDTGDKLATRSDISDMEDTVDKVYATLAGERLVSRTGLRGQRGTGWGYIQARLADDRRYWRLRVPELVTTPVSGKLEPGMIYSDNYDFYVGSAKSLYEACALYTSNTTDRDRRSVVYQVHFAEDVSGSYLSSYYPDYFNRNLNTSTGRNFPFTRGLHVHTYRHPALVHNGYLIKEVIQTRDPYGSDGCFVADWRVGISNISPSRTNDASYINIYVNNRVATASSVTSAVFSVDIENSSPELGNQNSILGYTIPVHTHPIIIENLVVTNGSYISEYHSVTQAPVAFLIEHSPFSSSASEVTFAFRSIYDFFNDTTVKQYSNSSLTTLTSTYRARYGVRMVSPPFYVKFSATAKRLEDNICVYKIMSSDLDSKLLYDDERKTTWELKIDGGKLFIEEISAGDFRKEDL